MASVAVPAPAPGPSRVRRWFAGFREKETWIAYLFLLPWLFGFLVFTLGPMLFSLYYSFTNYGVEQIAGIEPTKTVGLDNYQALVRDPYLWQVLIRTVVFCLANAALTMVIGIGIALLMRLMSRPIRLLAQSGLLLAWAMPIIASLTVWQWLFDTQYGIVNWTLTRLGGDFQGHSWLLEPLSFYFVATVIVVWMSVPFVAFTGYAALTQVSEDLLEAAELDGAGVWQRLRHVVVPAIRPVLLIVGLLQVIWDLRVFTQIYVLQSAGGVTRETNLLGTYIYRLGIGGGDFGTAAAVAMFMLALTVVLTAPYVRLMLKAEND